MERSMPAFGASAFRLNENYRWCPRMSPDDEDEDGMDTTGEIRRKEAAEEAARLREQERLVEAERRRQEEAERRRRERDD